MLALGPGALDWPKDLRKRLAQEGTGREGRVKRCQKQPQNGCLRFFGKT